MFISRNGSIASGIESFGRVARHYSMLAKTHGQPASPTRPGKEVMVYVSRLNQQIDFLKAVPCPAKFGGATGNYNAHTVAYPAIDWKKFREQFRCRKLGLEREQWTTQISNYDNMAAQFDALKRINTILIDLCWHLDLRIDGSISNKKSKPAKSGHRRCHIKIHLWKCRRKSCHCQCPFWIFCRQNFRCHAFSATWPTALFCAMWVPLRIQW